MARDRGVQDLGELARGIRQAYLAVDAAIPLLFAEAGVVPEQASPEQEHVMALRETAFAMALQELLDFDYHADPADLAALERGILPAPRGRAE
jgi:hypothetical protein